MIAVLAIVLGAVGIAYAVWPARHVRRPDLRDDFAAAVSDAEAAAALRRWSQASGELADGPGALSGGGRLDL